MQFPYPLIPRSCLNNQHVGKIEKAEHHAGMVTLYCEDCPAFKDLDRREYEKMVMLAPRGAILFSLP